jgi:DNA-binding NtrC family response regulator
VRVIAATNRDLETSVQQGLFREDLYYRLNVVNLHLPALRERREDIPRLVAHFIGEQNAKFGTRVKGLSPEALQAAYGHHWPGNIRQLRNAIEAAMAMESADTIGLDAFSQVIGLPPQDTPSPESSTDGSDYASTLAQFEIGYLRQILKRTSGNVEAAAQLADMNMATIYRKMKKYGLRKEDFT